MPGYRQWADGDALLPSDLDDYLMGQTLMRFASAAARTAAITSPVAGMRSYLADTGLEYIYSGTTWAPMLSWLKKAANETVTSNATLQDDEHLTTTLVPGTFRVELFAHGSGGSTGDIKLAWAFAGTATESSRTCFGPGVNTTNTEATAGAATTVGVTRASTHFITTEVSYGLDGTNNSGIHEDLFLVVTSGGILKLQWSQNVSNGTGATLSSASRMYVTRLA
jgi:hypothetical protein